MDPHTLPGIILLLPFASALTILLFHSLLKNFAHLISTAVSVVICVGAVLLLAGPKEELSVALIPFLNIGDFHVNIGAILDNQSRGMLFIVTFVGMLVHIYSTAYMADDKGKARFFGALSLFMFSMIGIVLADNLIMMFLFWELVGVSSYLLIGHWFEKPSASDAAKKAFITNRVGDFGFMTGILILFALNNDDLSFEGLKGSMAQGNLHAISAQNAGIMTIAALGIFLGAMGKSAQAPLHVWLPDAMEGPTPVSALIHAATMVAAGVYMLVRTHFLFIEGGTASTVIMWVGGITALMAALMATQQNDIKKVLAYSTLSQLGYMVMAVGLAAPEAGMFHLYTHAFFKALLFLGAGAVIHSCHHEQDIWKMGGLSKTMPLTFYTFVIGTAALMGVPVITSGFYSKEGILGAAYEHNTPLFIIGIITATLTAFYMTRVIVVAFLGKARSEEASHAHEAPLVMLLPLLILAVPSLISQWLVGPLQAMTPHEHGDGHTIVVICSLVALITGLLLGTSLYKGKDADPVNIPLFANKFYFDEFYAGLIKYAQDRFAWIVNALEKIFVESLTVRMPPAIAAALGNQFRKLQGGNLQSYTFLLGFGVIVAVYIAVSTTAKH